MKLAMLPHSHPRWLVAGMLVAMAMVVSGGFDLIRQQQLGMPLDGADGGRARLLVVDPQADRLTVYDAVDGRPLQRLDAEAAATMLQTHDGRVLVMAADGTRSEPASSP